MDGNLLVADGPGDHLAVSDLVHVRVHQAGDQRLTEAEAGLDGRHLAVAGDGIGGKQDARHMREDHTLHDHGHANLPVVDAIAETVGHGPLGKERGPAPADVLKDRRRPDDIEVRILLPRERGSR